jgi:hypothetical protein
MSRILGFSGCFLMIVCEDVEDFSGCFLMTAFE